MTRSSMYSQLGICGLVAFVLTLAAPALAQPARSAAVPPRQHISIGYVGIEGDSCYEPVLAYKRLIRV